MITYEFLRALYPTCPPAKLHLYLPALTSAMTEFAINTPKRAAAFLGQVGQESGELKWFREIWGPTPAQLRYEGRVDLGNTQKGDGKRFMGRGPIQITGRANYREFGRLLGLPLEAQPELAEDYAVGFRIAGAYWQKKGLNAFADVGNIREITRRINGGYTHYAERLAYTNKALSFFVSGDIPRGMSPAAKSEALIGGGAAVLIGVLLLIMATR